MNWYFYVDTLLLSVAILVAVWMTFNKPRFHNLLWCLRWLAAVSFIIAQTTWTFVYLNMGEAGLMLAKVPWLVFNVLAVFYIALKTWGLSSDTRK